MANSEMAGNYYNFYAATAGTGNPSLSTGNATDSICPYGWQLAEYSGDKSFQNLVATIYNSKTDTVFSNADTSLLALSFLRSGYCNYSNSALTNRGMDGNYWSLRGGSGTNASYLAFNSIYIGPQYGSNRGLGQSLRCLAR